MSFPRYPAYKPSGVEWLGEVPEHWEVKPLKRVAEVQTGLAKGKEVEPEGSVEVPFLRVANVQDNFLDLENVHMITIQESSLSRYLLRPGDVLMNEGGDFDKLGRGCIWDGAINPCIHQNHVFAVRPHSIRPSWLNAYASSKQANSYFISRSKQSTNLASISSSNLMDLLVPIAPNSETEEILSFLDRETAKIDALIAEQQRLIELLQEKRQAVISHAVTKGLNPNAPMKDSGVEWLGEVPEHWTVCGVGYRYEVRLGKMLDEKRVTGQHLGPYLRNTDVQWESINTEDLPEMDFDPSEHERYSLIEGDLLVCEGGEVGRSAIWQSSLAVCFYQKALHRLRPLNASQDSPRFQLYIMRMACSKGVFEASSGKATINHLPAEAFRRYRFAYPPVSEQQKISEHLSTACGEIRRLQQEASSLVLTLQERRSALISVAVTGQIDVRGLGPEVEAA